MKQEKIDYDEIMSLGFTEEIVEDEVYYDRHGFDYAIITKDLTKEIGLEWAKETKLCEMVIIDNPKTCNVKAILPVMKLQHLKNLIDSFSTKD